MKSASASRNTTRRLPESMSDPRVGQLLADKDADVGAYARVSNPAALKTVSYAEGARSSELTISRDTTNGRQRGQLGFQYPPIALDPVSHSPSFGLASIHVFTAVYGKLSALFIHVWLSGNTFCQVVLQRAAVLEGLYGRAEVSSAPQRHLPVPSVTHAASVAQFDHAAFVVCLRLEHPDAIVELLGDYAHECLVQKRRIVMTA